MTNADMVTTAPAPSTASALDDIIEVLYRPSAVFARRRADPKFWGALIIVAVLMAVAMYLLMTNMSAAIESQYSRQIQATARTDPQRAEAMANMRGMAMTMGRIIPVVIAPIAILLLGIFTWLVGKIFGANMNLNHGFVIATMAWVPRVIGTIVSAVLAMLMGGETLQGMNVVSIGPARFLDPLTASQRDQALLMRLDVWTIWATILIAIGLHVIGGISKGKAAAAAIVLWLVATAVQVLPVLNQ